MRHALLVALCVAVSACSMNGIAVWVPPPSVPGLPVDYWRFCQDQASRFVRDHAVSAANNSSPYSEKELACITAATLRLCGDAVGARLEESGASGVCVVDFDAEMRWHEESQCEDVEKWLYQSAARQIHARISGYISHAFSTGTF